MVVTVEELYKEIFASFPGQTSEFESKEVFNLINQCYIELRDQYIKAGQGEEFSVSETFSSFTVSKFTYFKTTTLANPVLQSFPLDTVIISTFIRTVPELTDVNTLNKTFKPEDVRNYSPGNGLKYFKNDVVFEDGLAYRAIGDIVVTSTDPLIDQVNVWEPVYWMKKGIGQVNAEVIDYRRVDRHKIAIDSGTSVVTALRDSLFVSNDVESITIEYISEHVYVNEPLNTLLIPDGARKELRNKVIRSMLQMLPATQINSEENGERE